MALTTAFCPCSLTTQQRAGHKEESAEQMEGSTAGAGAPAQAQGSHQEGGQPPPRTGDLPSVSTESPVFPEISQNRDDRSRTFSLSRGSAAKVEEPTGRRSGGPGVRPSLAVEHLST